MHSIRSQFALHVGALTRFLYERKQPCAQHSMRTSLLSYVAPYSDYRVRADVAF